MKKLARKAVATVLGYQVRRLIKKNNVQVIGVVGSVGKTSTKLAIAKVLESKFRVRYQRGNYNDLVTVPLVFFGEDLPSLFNPFAWLATFWRIQKRISKPYPFDMVVIELGSNGPGQIEEFKIYLKLDIAVITAITPEHMQFFGSLDNVAREELAVNDFSSLIFANKDLCDQKYLENLSQLLTYSLKKGDFTPATFGLDKNEPSDAVQYSHLAAAAVGHKLGMEKSEIVSGLKNIEQVSGRLQILKGLGGSIIIDDTYNASPVAAKLALDYLYKLDSSQKIAIIGNMNELGDYAKQAHKEVGNYCDPKQLGLVATIGPDANRYLASAAKSKGCKVISFDDPYSAAEHIKPMLQKGTIVLVKGSQSGVFAEETVKLLLADQADAKKLVRQSQYWMNIKRKAFNR